MSWIRGYTLDVFSLFLQPCLGSIWREIEFPPIRCGTNAKKYKLVVLVYFWDFSRRCCCSVMRHMNSVQSHTYTNISHLILQ